jgi:hypothetical protein
MKKKLGLTLTLILVAAIEAHPAVARPSGIGRICPDLPPDCCVIKRGSGCPICILTGCG